MSLHTRYLHQASWTREIRSYLFGRAGWISAQRILEVGCGTGAVLRDPAAGRPRTTDERLTVYGIDCAPDALAECSTNASAAILARGDAAALPFQDQAFDIAYCHFLLLWVGDPLGALREMKRVTRGHVLALAEPDYMARIDLPAELAPLGLLQTQALRAQGADVSIGSRLADLFDQAGIRIVESGPISPQSRATLTAADLQAEWTMLETDLAHSVPRPELERFRLLDKRARESGDRLMHVPTYFAWGQV